MSYRRRDPATWLVGLATSMVGDQVFYVALSWAAIQVTSPGGVGLILLANAVPRALTLMIGGALVDRFGPRRLVIGSDALRLAVMAGIAVIIWLSGLGPVALAVVAVVFGVVDGFFLPAVGAMPAYVAPVAQQTRLQALKSTVNRGAVVAGAPLASLLIVVGGLPLAFAANAVLFAVSVGALLWTRVRSPEVVENVPEPAVATRSTWSAELLDGVRVVWTMPRLRILVGLVTLLELGFSGPMTVGIPLLAAERGWGVAGVGWVLGGFGAGAVVVSLALAARPTPRSPQTMAVGGLAAMGAGVCLLGSPALVAVPPAGQPVVAAALGVLAGIGAGLFGTLANAALVVAAPTAQLGRVMAVVLLAGDVMLPVSLVATGWVTDVASVGVPFVAGGLLLLLGAAVAAASWRSALFAVPARVQ